MRNLSWKGKSEKLTPCNLGCVLEDHGVYMSDESTSSLTGKESSSAYKKR